MDGGRTSSPLTGEDTGEGEKDTFVVNGHTVPYHRRTIYCLDLQVVVQSGGVADFPLP